MKRKHIGRHQGADCYIVTDGDDVYYEEATHMPWEEDEDDEDWGYYMDFEDDDEA